MKRSLLVIVLLSITSVIRASWHADKVEYSICAIPLIVDVYSKYNNNKDRYNVHDMYGRMTMKMTPQIVSGVVSGLIYGAYFYNLKTGRIPNDPSWEATMRNFTFLFTVPVVVNLFVKTATNHGEGFNKAIFQDCSLHVKRGCGTGICAATIFALSEYVKLRK